MLDPKFTKAIVAAWRADESHPNRGKRKAELPEFLVIGRFLDEAFLATLRDEEGKNVEFSIALVRDNSAFGEVHADGGSGLLKFEETIEFSAANLVKLASAFDPSLSTILVGWTSDGVGLFIWGILLRRPSSNRFTEVPIFVGVGSKSVSTQDSIILVSKGRASLVVARGESQIGTFQSGYFKTATPTPFTSHSLGQHVLKFLEYDPIFQSKGVPYWIFVRDGLEILLSEAARRGHGGTIVLAPFGVNSYESCFVSKHKFSGSFELGAKLAQCVDSESNTKWSIAYKKEAYEALQRVAQLAAVDGALVLNYSLEVLAFGATLTAPRTDIPSIIAPDGFGRASGSPFDIRRYGTRHRSAMDFAAQIPGAILFVISQDGPIRAFMRVDDSVQVWPDCTTSMFL